MLLPHAIKLYPYMGRDENYDPTLEVNESVVRKSNSSLPNQDVSNYHVVMNKFFTSLPLLRLLKELGIAATGTVRINSDEKALLKSVKEIEKLKRGSLDFLLVLKITPILHLLDH